MHNYLNALINDQQFLYIFVKIQISVILPLNTPPPRIDFFHFCKGVFRGFFNFSKKKSNEFADYGLVYQMTNPILQKSKGVPLYFSRFIESIRESQGFPCIFSDS